MKWKMSRFICLFVLVLLSTAIAALAEGSFVLNLPANLDIIDAQAFEAATALEKVVVPMGTTEIRSRAFADSSLVEINLPSTIEYIADDAFEGCEGLVVMAEKGTYAYDWCVDHGFISEGLAIISLKCSHEGTAEIGDTLTWVIRTAGGKGAISYHFDVYCNDALICTQDATTKNYVTLQPESTGIYRVEAYCYDAEGSLSLTETDSITVLEQRANITQISGNNGVVAEGETLNWSIAAEGGTGLLQYRYEVLLNNECLSSGEYTDQNQYSYVAAESGNYVLAVTCRDAMGRITTSKSKAIFVYSSEEVYPVAPELVFEGSSFSFSTTDADVPEYEPQSFELMWGVVDYADRYEVNLLQKQGTEWIDVFRESVMQGCTFRLGAANFGSLTEKASFRLDLTSQGMRTGGTATYYFDIAPAVVDTSLTINGAANATWNQNARFASSRVFTIASALEWEVESVTEVKIWSDDDYGTDWIAYRIEGNQLEVSIEETTEERKALITLSNGVSTAGITVWQCVAEEAPVITHPASFSTDINHPTEYPVGEFDLRWNDNNNERTHLRVSELMEDGSRRLVYDTVTSRNYQYMNEAYLGETLKANTTYEFELEGVCSTSYRQYEVEDDILKTVYYVHITEDGHTIKVNNTNAVTYSNILSQRCFVTASNYFNCSTDADWLTTSETYVKRHGYYITIKAELNDTGISRVGHAYFTCGGATATATVIQDDMSLKILYPEGLSKDASNPTKLYMDLNLLDTNYFYFIYQGEDLYLERYTNGAYGEKIRIANRSDFEIQEVEIETEDVSPSSHCRLTVTYDTYSEEYYVDFVDSEDTYYDAFYNVYLMREEGAHRHTITLDSDAVTGWTVSSNVSWLTPSVETGKANEKLTVTIAENTTGLPRTGRLTFRSTENDGVKWQDIKQLGEDYLAVYYYNPATSCYELYDPSVHCTKIHKGKEVQTDYFKAYATDRIDVVSNVSWIHSTDSSPDSGISFKLKLDENPAGNGIRTGTVTITNGVSRQDITISQAPNLGEISLTSPALSVDRDNPSVIQYDDLALKWNAVQNADRYVVELNDGSTYHTIAKIDDTGAANYTCSIPKELLGAFVENRVYITAYDAYGYYSDEGFYFMPVSGDAALINGSSAAVWDNAADTNISEDFVIQSSANWTASASQSWITLSASSGVSGDILSVTLAENTGSSPRSGQVIISVNNANSVLNINQCAYLAEEYPSLSTPVLSQDMANPTIMDTGKNLTLTWVYEPQAISYELTLYRQKTQNVRSVIAESDTFLEEETSYTFTNLELEKGVLYSIGFCRRSDRYRSTSRLYYFMLPDEDAWVLADGKSSDTMEEDGAENAAYYTITSSGYWSAQVSDDWLMVYKDPLDQEELDAKEQTSSRYSMYSGVSGDMLCVSMLANPDSSPRTGRVQISCGSAVAEIIVYQYQKYSIAQLVSPAITTSSSVPTALPYGSITFNWSEGKGGTGRYQLRLEYKDPKWGWEKVFDRKDLTSRSSTVAAGDLVEGGTYRIWLGTEITEGDYDGRRYYFQLEYENALTPVLRVDWSNAAIGGRVDVYGSATGGAGGYCIAYELLCDGERAGITTWGANGFYNFPIIRAGAYQVRLYVKDASGKQKDIVSDTYTVGAGSTADYLRISQSAWAVEAAGGSTSISVDSSGSWTASASANWISVSTSGSQTCIAVAQNTATSARSGQVLFTSGSHTATLSISQQGAVVAGEAALTLSQSVWNLLNPSAAMLNLSIEATGDWSVSGKPDWIDLSQTSGSGSTAVSVYASYNSGGTRTAELVFAIGGNSKRLYVTQVGADIVAQVLSVQVSNTKPLTGEEVVFTIRAKNADELLYMVDGQLIDTINVLQDTVSYRWTYSLAKANGREVCFVPRRDGIQGLISEPILMNVVSYGDLASPTIRVADKVNLGDDAYISWSEVANADHYTVYLYSNDSVVYRKPEIRELYHTIEAEDIPGVGTYTLLVMASAKGYNQSEGADFLRVAMPEETFELVEPKTNYAFDVGNKIAVKISNPDGYMLQAQIKKDGKVVALLPESGPAADLNPLYWFTPVEGGKHEFSILAYNSTGSYQWNEGAALVSIDIKGPTFKDGSIIGTGARGMMAEDAARFRIVTNTAVKKVVVNDGVQDYTAENPVLITSGEWKHVFSGAMNAQSQGRRVYQVTAFDDYGHSVSRPFVVYAAERVSEHTLYPTASSVKIVDAPDQIKASAILYPSDSVKVKGQCGNYWYVEYGETKGFVQKDDLGPTRLTTWEGLQVSFVELSNQNLSLYIKDNAYAIIRWTCNYVLPDTAKYRVSLIDKNGNEQQVYFGGNTNAKVKTATAGDYTVKLEVISSDKSIVYTTLISTNRLIVYSTFGKYLKNTSPDVFDEDVGRIHDSLIIALNAHRMFASDKPFTDSEGNVMVPIDISDLTAKGLWRAYANLFGNSEYDSGVLKSAYIAETMMMSLSTYKGGTVQTIPTDVFDKIMDTLGIAKDFINTDIYWTLRNYGFHKDYLKYMFDCHEVDWGPIVSGVSDGLGYANDLFNAYNKYLYYSNVDEDELATIILAFSKSGVHDLEVAAGILNQLKDKDQIWNYLLGSYGFKKAWSSCEKNLGKLIKGFLPKEWALTISASVGVNDLVMNISNMQKKSYEALWAIEAADAYYSKVQVYYCKMIVEPDLFFDDFVEYSRVFCKLVALEYEAFADLGDTLDDALLKKIVNFFKGTDGYSKMSANCHSIANAVRTILEYPLERFYLDCLLPHGYSSIYY